MARLGNCCGARLLGWPSAARHLTNAVEYFHDELRGQRCIRSWLQHGAAAAASAGSVPPQFEVLVCRN